MRHGWQRGQGGAGYGFGDMGMGTRGFITPFCLLCRFENSPLTTTDSPAREAGEQPASTALTSDTTWVGLRASRTLLVSDDLPEGLTELTVTCTATIYENEGTQGKIHQGKRRMGESGTDQHFQPPSAPGASTALLPLQRAETCDGTLRSPQPQCPEDLGGLITRHC